MMTRDELEFDLTEAVDEKYSRDRRNVARLRILSHDAEQRAEIARLLEALVEIIEKCEDEDWEYMFGDIIMRAKQALKESMK